MPKILVFAFCFCLTFTSWAQEIDPDRYAEEFEAAYEANPLVPQGILEAVAFAQTRINHISGNNAGCSGIPQVKGVMGLTEDGKGYFKNNLVYVSELSEISIANIKSNPADNIMAYARAFQIWVERKDSLTENSWVQDEILKTLSEIPWDKNDASDFALSCFTYEVFRFLDNPVYQDLFDFPSREIDYEGIYGSENYAILSSTSVFISEEEVRGPRGRLYRELDQSAEYGPALWNAAPSCNYSSRGGEPISAVTVHTIQGSYAGAISWAQNCLSNVSYHYVARSSDGQITQMVNEADKAWHVGSENPYTIGIEHEGYVDDPIWYTEAMYVASAYLVRDITESGYGINPLRTYQGPATAGTLTLGACTKIKGHQHFPGASHTDPGINWDWEHYYRLINDGPEVTLYTEVIGTLFDSGGAADPYENDERLLYLIQPDGAASITLNVISFNIEEDWDYLYVYDGEDLDATLIDTYTGTDIPDIITSSGGSILLEFRSDCGITEDGWEIEWTIIEGDGDGDELAPVTEVLLDEVWYTEDFAATFSDLDDSAGSGVRYQFYQIIDHNEIEWRANQDHGFFSDNFDDAIHPDWTALTGTWEITDEVLSQTDEALGNTNIYASLNQDDFDQYFYHWSGKIGGVGEDKRAGLHFMCDDATLLNRGNSYFVWFREDHNRIQIYKVVEDVFSLENEVDFDFSPDFWYDFKTVYDKTSGEIHVWINNVHQVSWTDDSPLMAGNAISFRSGNAVATVNNFKVYHNRPLEVEVEVGPTGDARYQNADPYTPAAKVKSIIIDSAYNVSTIGARLIDVDWTPPLPIAYLNDGEDEDVETTTSNTELLANWEVTTDPNSGIARYWYAIGSAPGDSNIVIWTDNWYADTVRHTGLSLDLGETYYFSVVAENGAGLFSDTIISNGQTLVEPTEPPLADFVADNTDLCGVDSVQLENGSTDALTYEWFIPEGSPSYSTEINPYVSFVSSGEYDVMLVAEGPGGVDTLEQVVSVEVNEPPIAAFSPSDDLVFIDDALITFENTSLNADGYYWDFGDDNFSTDTDPWHEYTMTGDFDVMLIALNGDCPNDTVWTVIKVREVDGILEEGISKITIFPNPAQDMIQVSGFLSDTQHYSYFVLDSRGRQVRAGQLSNHTQIDVSGLAKGVYHMEVMVDDYQLLTKFVIQ